MRTSSKVFSEDLREVRISSNTGFVLAIVDSRYYQQLFGEIDLNHLRLNWI
jgi:hypothetical protein